MHWGGNQNPNKVTQTDLLNAIHYGAQEVVMDEDVTEENIDEILLKSKAKTEEFNKELNKIEQRFNLDQISFTGDDQNRESMYYFEGEDYKSRQK